MRKTTLLILAVLVLSMLACGLVSGVQQIQAAASQMPAMLTSAPTELGSMETTVAQYTPPASDTTPGAPVTLSLNNAELILKASGQFDFQQGTVNGQSATIATLSTNGASSFTGMQGFTAQFVGDPNNLSSIILTAPLVSQSDITSAIAVDDVILVTVIPAEQQSALVTWLSQDVENMSVPGQQQTTLQNLQFTAQATQSSFILRVQPSQ